MSIRLLKVLTWSMLFFAAFGLVGCSTGYAPVTDRSITQKRNVDIVSSREQRAQAQAPASGEYIVKRGDTLYSIAWKYGLDYRKLAASNNIDRRYRIYVGQRLRLSASETAVVAKVEPVANAEPELTKESTSLPTEAQSASTPPSASASPPNVERESVEPTNNTASLPTGPIQWRWPASGRVISGFSSKGEVNKGIDLEGKQGDPVFAAAPGRVVYAGSGLIGYGNLIIINHNQEYLSAYAHNSRLLVTESDNVNVGDKIAEIGNSGAEKTMLHFEIRKDGKPVNPLKYLPKR